MTLVNKKFAALYASAILMGVGALFGSPSSALAEEECVIECEKCTCNLKTGVCDCTNCKLTGCKPQ
jgi:hypothetical protein